MKAVVVVESVPPYFAARFRALIDASPTANITILSVTGKGEFDQFVSAKHLVRLPIVQLAQGGRQEERGRSVWELLDKENPELVAVAGWAFPGSLYSILWARKRGRKILLMSDSSARDAPRHWLREKIKSRVVRACDSALVAGRDQRAYAVSLGLIADNVFEGYDAVDNEFFHDGAREARLDRDSQRTKWGLPDRYILASARFVPKKNLGRLIAAYSRVAITTPNAPHLVILGDGPGRGLVETAIREAGLSGRVHLPGFRSYDTLPVYYGLADSFVHVSTSEQWGLVVNEAAAAGLPLIVSRACGASTELVRDGENGFLVDAYDVKSIAAALSAMIALSTDRRSEMGLASKVIVDNWGTERFAIEFMKAYDAAMHKPARWVPPWDSFLFKILARQIISEVQ